MASSFISTGISGAFFGSALLFSGVYTPSTITSQLALSDFYMLKVFLTASGSSAILFEIAKWANIAPCEPRKSSELNRLHRYDGNVIGGLLLGCGMALTGACPGTVLVQVASGVSSGVTVLAGGILGGILWSRCGNLTCAPRSASTATKKDSPCKEANTTVYAFSKLTSTQAVLIYELVVLATIISASYLFPHGPGLHRQNPIVGGLVIGGAQAASLLLTRAPVGVSTAYERAGQYICRLAGLSPSNKSWPSPSPVIFALGMLLGAWGLSKTLGISPGPEMAPISVARAIVGGASLIVGARTAGGCTSGHGISGMSTLSKASFVTVGAMFAGGIGLTSVLGLFA